MTPIEEIISEVADGRMLSIDRELFPILNRLLNERGYHCVIAMPAGRDFLIEIHKNALTTGQRP